MIRRNDNKIQDPDQTTHESRKRRYFQSDSSLVMNISKSAGYSSVIIQAFIVDFFPQTFRGMKVRLPYN